MGNLVKMYPKLLVITIVLNLAIASGYTTVAKSEPTNIEVTKNTSTSLHKSKVNPQIMFDPPEEKEDRESENSRGGASR
ncbi:MAG: hypothetical protein WBA93_32990 [Microcoleaceae cyanobacterium]